MVTELRMIQYTSIYKFADSHGVYIPRFFDSWLYHLNPKASKTIQNHPMYSKIILCNLWDGDQFFLQPSQSKGFWSHEPLLFSLNFPSLIGLTWIWGALQQAIIRVDWTFMSWCIAVPEAPIVTFWMVHRFHGLSPAEAFLVGRGATKRSF